MAQRSASKTLAPARKRWHERPSLQTALTSAGGVLGGIAACWNTLAGGRLAVSVVSASAALFALAGGVAKGRTEVSKESKAAEPSPGLAACIFTIIEIVRTLKGLPGDQQWSLRGTVHAPLEDGSGKLVQCIDYHGGDHDGAGRLMPDHCGVTGQAFRDKKPKVFERTGSNTDQFHRELETTYGFSPEQVRTLRPDRWCAIAVPIYGEDASHVVGVAYFDSDVPGFFDEKTQELILLGCAGLTKYIATERSE